MVGLRTGRDPEDDPSRSAVTHTEPAPTAIAGQPGSPTSITCPVRLVCGLIDVTAPSLNALMYQTPSRAGGEPSWRCL